MKKTFIIILALVIIATVLVSCGNKTERDDNGIDETGKVTEETTQEDAKDTLGKTLLKVFKEQAKKETSTKKIAQEIANNPNITFNAGISAVEEGLIAGFDNTEITGFESGYMIAPAVGSIPFVGYVFELENEENTDDFKKKLEENANPRWNICVEAEETVVESVGNKVFFVMCPVSLEN